MFIKLKNRIKAFGRNIVYEGVERYFNNGGGATGENASPKADTAPNLEFADVQSSALFEVTHNPIITSDERKAYYEKEHNLLDYHIQFFNALTCKIDLKGKRVLEIGGSNMPKELVINEAGATKWVCIDKSWGYGFAEKHKSKIPVFKFGEVQLKDALDDYDYVIYDGYAEQMTKDFYEQFDVCISNCCFEHVTQLPVVLDLIYCALRDTGKLYAEFGPPWSSVNGNHLWIIDEGNNIELTHGNFPAELGYAHLYLGYASIYNKLESMYGSNFAKKNTFIVKNGEHLNRLFFEDYVFIMHKSLFRKKSVSPVYLCKISDETMSCLRNTYAGYKRFNVACISIQAIK
jgi:SAM-dependent methyltransferase